MQVKHQSRLKKLRTWSEELLPDTWANLCTDHLWQRMLKNTLATTITVIIALIPAVVAIYGKAAYLGPITTVFGHPGRRFGMMAEALVLALSGTMLGIGWSMLGLCLSGLVIETNAQAAYTIRGLFLAIALIFHGFLRSHSPRLFTMVLLMIIVAVVSLTGTASVASTIGVTTLLYPILTAAGILILINILVFPEFSSTFLGATTIETLDTTVGALRDAGNYFVTINEGSTPGGDGEQISGESELHDEPSSIVEESKKQKMSPVKQFYKFLNKKLEERSEASSGTVKLKSLTDAKAELRTQLASCKAAQQECNFEVAWAVLPPRDLKPISDTSMKKLVANTIALINACESKYALMGEGDDNVGDESNVSDLSIADAGAAGLENGGEPLRPGSSSSVSAESLGCSKKEKTKKVKKGKKGEALLYEKLEDLELIKPRKEIQSADIELLRFLVGKISLPLRDLQNRIDSSVNAINSCLAYCYDVRRLPSGGRAPRGIELAEIDIWIDNLASGISDFDRDSASALESAAALHDLEHPHIDIMPRMEIFLISSFLLNLRQAALHTLEMLNHSRILVEKRQSRRGRPRLYAPKIKWSKWLASGGEEDGLVLPEQARKNARSGQRNHDAEDDPVDNSDSLLAKKDVESAPPKTLVATKSRTAAKTDRNGGKRHNTSQATLSYRMRNTLADILEYLAGSDDMLYAFKLTIAVFLVTWPAFLEQWNAWYSLNRGLWAALQLVLITEVAIGTSVMTFSLRAVGTTIGCVWGYAAYEAGNGNRFVCVVLLVIGIIPSTYIQLGTKYVKAGMVSIISMCIVALATVDKTVPGTATENFLKRLLAFLIGGIVALIVEVVLFPVKARDRLVESLSASIRQISEMEACLAFGIETEVNIDVHSTKITERFDRAKGKADDALTAAETFLPFCANEPRLKGSFKGLALVYAEILYVLHAIVDRMDNMLHIRHEYGSGVLEELNAKVYPYRRNVAGSITLVLFAVHEALTTKVPLPQFLPSARLAHLRMVNRVREVVAQKHDNTKESSDRGELEVNMVRRVIRQKFLSWNAASAGQIEVIEFLEELIELVKLLVGANEFRSGLLTRPTYREYVQCTNRALNGSDVSEEPSPVTAELSDDAPTAADPEADDADTLAQPADSNLFPSPPSSNPPASLIRRRTTTLTKDQKIGADPESTKSESGNQAVDKEKQVTEGEIPRSLQRVRSRRVEEMQQQQQLQRQEQRRELARTVKEE